MEIEAIDTRFEAQVPKSRVRETESYIYLYCFFKGPSSLSPRKGIDRTSTTFVLSYMNLCALVSPVPIDEYNEQILSRQVEDLQWLTPRVKHHEEIIRYVMGFHPVIPIKFGTIYANSERLLEILRSGHDELYHYLDFVSDKEEWGIKVYAEEGAGRKTIEASSELVGQLNERIPSASPGQAYLLRKKKENLIRQQSIDYLTIVADRIYGQLLPWAVEGRRNKLLSRQATQAFRDKESDMILNAAFLLHKLDVEIFKEKISALAINYASDDLSFEISGPWPCYNFCPNFGPSGTEVGGALQNSEVHLLSG